MTQPASKRLVTEADITDPTSAAGGAIVDAIGDGIDTQVSGLLTVVPSEQRAAVAYGRVPALATAPPAVTITHDLANIGVSAIPGGNQTAASGWYTSVAPNDTAKLRFLGCSAPVAGDQATYPNGFSAVFTHLTAPFGGAAWTVETVLSNSRYIEFVLRQSDSIVFRVMVDGQYVTTRAVSLGGTANAFGSVLVDVGDATKPRTVTFETNATRLYGINLPATGSPTASRVPGPTPQRLEVLGDSYTGGAGAISSISTFARTLGWLLGYRDLMNSGVGSTGYLAPGSGVKFRNRIANDVIAQNPSRLVIAGGHNDTGSSNSAIAAEVTALLTAIRAGLPNLPIAIVGPFFVGGPGGYAAMQDAIFAGAAGFANIALIDTCTVPLFTADNIAKYILGDGVHPTQAGHDYLAHPIAAALAEAGFTAA